MLSPLRTRSPSLVTALIVSILVLANSTQAASHSEKIYKPVSSGRFHLLSEPSGIIALDADTFIVIEDESSNALRRLSLTQSDPSKISFTEHEQVAGKGFIQRQLLGPLEDLEGIARISPTQFIVMGSHQKASRGKQPEREKIVLFTIEGDDIVDASERRDLFDQLEKHYPALTQIMTQKGGDKDDREPLNIESIALDRKRMHLYIGLRTPLVDHEAVIVKLENALQFMVGKEPVFGAEPIYLDLDKGGIRAMAYDDITNQLLIISKRESGGKKRTRLWSLTREANAEPVKWKTDDKDLFDKVEGIAPFEGGLLFVRDQGNDRDLDDWFVLERGQLGLDVPAQ